MKSLFHLNLSKLFGVFFSLQASFSLSADESLYIGNLSPQTMPIYQAEFQDLWAAQLNFALFSLLYSETKEPLRFHEQPSFLVELANEFRKDPIQVEARIVSLSDDLQGFNFDFFYRSKIFKKILISQNDTLRLRVFTKIVGCDQELNQNSKSGHELESTTEALVKLLSEKSYSANQPFRCDFNVRQVLINDGASANSSTPALDIIFNNKGKSLVSNVFDFELKEKPVFTSYGGNVKVNSIGRGQVVLSVFNDFSIAVHSTTDSFVYWVGSSAEEDEERAINFFSFKLFAETKSRTLNSVGVDKIFSTSTRLVELIDEYRKVVLASYALDPGHRAAFARAKLDELRAPIQSEATKFRGLVPDMDFVSRLMNMKTIGRAIDELSNLEARLNLIESPLEGISSLNLEKYIE